MKTSITKSAPVTTRDQGAGADPPKTVPKRKPAVTKHNQDARELELEIRGVRLENRLPHELRGRLNLQQRVILLPVADDEALVLLASDAVSGHFDIAELEKRVAYESRLTWPGLPGLKYFFRAMYGFGLILEGLGPDAEAILARGPTEMQPAFSKMLEAHRIYTRMDKLLSDYDNPEDTDDKAQALADGLNRELGDWRTNFHGHRVDISA